MVYSIDIVYVLVRKGSRRRHDTEKENAHDRRKANSLKKICRKSNRWMDNIMSFSTI